MKNLLLFTFIFIVGIYISYGQSAATCDNAYPFCSGTTYEFSASTNTSAETGPDYGCLCSQPNPT